MLFNTLQFGFFFILVFTLYWWIGSKKIRLQNLLLFGASLFFYACWDWRFLFLLTFTFLIDFFIGIKIEAAEKKSRKKKWLWASILINLSFLGFFKYFNFFIESFAILSDKLGIENNFILLNIILPVGISFYTFHGLSYVIDVYNGKVKAEKNLIDYALFVSFFPLLVAGPIERATHLLPQLKKTRSFDYARATDGLKQILWGLFKKVVIADNCAYFVNIIFDPEADFSGSTYFIGALFFTFQIYGDFSGYSDIAIGTARLLGIELLRNFAYPYFSRNIAEFWRRWHISLSSWFRDYVYIPMGGSKGKLRNKIRNVFIIFLLSGFWHGANWTFLVWGFINAIFILPSFFMHTNRKHLEIVAAGKILPSLREAVSIIVTFLITVFAWVFFRAENITESFQIVSEIFSGSLFSYPVLPESVKLLPLLLLLCFFILLEWNGREDEFAIASLFVRQTKIMRWGFYYFMLIILFVFAGSTEEFIYFQF